LEGAERTSRETLTWDPSMGSPDQIINTVKPMADARSQDMMQNDGYAAGGAALHRDNIVGARFLLNSRPNWRLLGVSEEWAEEFQQVAEARFNTLSDSDRNWLDAAGRNNLSDLISLAVTGWFMTGEVLATAEWMKDVRRRPFKTAIQMISPARLENPDGYADSKYLRRGLVLDGYGKTTAYWIRKTFRTEFNDPDSRQFVKVPAETYWGRKMVLHVAEQRMPSQSRGVADMVAVLKQMRMTKRFQEITLQSAVVNASYAAAIESDLPSAQVFEILGSQVAGGQGGMVEGFNAYLLNYLTQIQSYMKGAKNIAIDGAKIPHLPPGTKLNMQPLATPGGVGTGYEESLLRHVAAALGLSYEEFSRDYTKTNYSSARASMNNTWKGMQGKKRKVADKTANFIYGLWLEEEWNAGRLPVPAGKDLSWFYDPGVQDALATCRWIGAARGQIDETKETQAAILRIQNGLSTYEDENAALGRDYRETFSQLAREKKMLDTLGVKLGGDKVAKPTIQSAADEADEADERQEQEEES
jgi:lambda family phage portal protein